MYRNILLCVLMLLGAAAGCSKKFDLDSFESGSNLHRNGMISDKTVSFNFDIAGNIPAFRDVCNHIYFEGDTLCFSAEFSLDVEPGSISVWFVDSRDGRSFVAERVDVQKYRVSGFSLVGSLLEHVHHDDLARKPGEMPAVFEIPLLVRFEITRPEGVFRKEMPLKMTVRWKTQ